MKILLALILAPSLAFGYGAGYAGSASRRQDQKGKPRAVRQTRGRALAGRATAGRGRAFAGRRAMAGAPGSGLSGAAPTATTPSSFAYQGYGPGTLKNNPTSAPSSQRTSDSMSPAGSGSAITHNEAAAQWTTGLGVGGKGPPEQAAPAAGGAGGNGITTNGTVLGLDSNGQTVAQPGH